MKRQFLRTLIALTFPSLCFGADIIMAIMQQDDYTLLHSNTSVHVFDDGVYTYFTNTGFGGLCHSAKVGQFKGKFSQEVLTEIKNGLKALATECGKTPDCKTDEPARDAGYNWKINDTSGKEKKSYFLRSGEKNPTVFRTMLSQEFQAVESLLTLELKKVGKDSFSLVYQGNEARIVLPFSDENLLLLDSGGALIKLKEAFPQIHLATKTLQFKPKEEFRFQLPGQGKNSPVKLIYDTSSGDSPPGHINQRLTPCVDLL